MEITGPERLNVSSSINVGIKGLQKVESTLLAKDVVGTKLAGCKGMSVKTLLSRTRPQLGNGISGVLVASDGVITDPIALHELEQGFIVHSDASGEELPPSLGGPLRAIFPEGVAVQNSVCGTPKPINLKGVVKLELHSEFELTSAKIHKELTASAPRLIAEMEEFHKATLLAFAAVYGGDLAAMPEAVAIAALDARGFSLRVTRGGAAECDLLAPFPRPLAAASDVFPLAMEMHRACFAALSLSFKLRSGFYTEPVVVACRLASKSPRALLAVSAALATAATVAALMMRKTR